MLRNRRRTTAAIAVTLCFAISGVPSLAAAAMWGPAGSDRSRQVAGNDVVLGPGGMFEGKLFDRSGNGLEGKPVVMLKDARPVVSVTTGINGSFRIRGVPHGTHAVLVDGRQHLVRLWTRGTEPPSATQFAFIVAEDSVFRGQYNSCPPCSSAARGPRRWTSHSLYDMIEEHPVIAYTAITAMIAVPIILISEDEDR